MISLFAKPSAVKAKIVTRNQSPCLAVTFANSSPPLFWQLDLEKLSTFTLTLREQDGEWDLGLALPQGTFTSVAHFDERDDAEKAYAAVSAALLCGGKPAHSLWRWGIALIVLLALLSFAGQSIKGGAESLSRAVQNQNAMAEQYLKQQGPKEIVPGVPVDADDVITPPVDQ